MGYVFRIPRLQRWCSLQAQQILSEPFYLLIGPNGIVLVATDKIRLMTDSLKGKFATYPGPNIPDVIKTFHNIKSLKINKPYLFNTSRAVQCLKICYFPKAWKKAITISISKPGKDKKLLESYRFIVLLWR